jgi:hypothetical protein
MWTDVNLSQNEAVVRFADWLTTLTIEREVASGGGAGKAKIVLCGHRYVAFLTIQPTYSDMRR